MNQEILILVITAASFGFFHTLLGPDHYVPFIVMSKTGKWSKAKTFWVTALSGVGHVLGSVILGIIGIVLGLAIQQLTVIESYRGEIAAWLMISFGLIYFIWGLRRAYKNKKHAHFHIDEDKVIHLKKHYDNPNDQVQMPEKEKMNNITPWMLFTIFIFGPCEALIPFLMFPAIKESTNVLILVVIVFGVTTIFTMLSLVFIGSFGISFLSLGRMEKYSHSMAGLLIFFSGVAIKFLSL